MTKQDRWFSSPTQVFWCCKALIEGRVVSTKTEIREVNGWRLAPHFPSKALISLS